MMPALEVTMKKRLQEIAKERKLTPAEVWHNVVTERFLVRLCRSPYKSHFILKGGTLLAKQLQIGRETRDIDFVIKGLKDAASRLQDILTEIVAIDLDDGFTFNTPQIALLENFDMQYPGVQVKMGVRFANSTYPIFIDLGFGDAVVEKEQNILLVSSGNTPLFEESVSLKCYPMEFVFAEKLETMIYRGENNSRMKDFHDLYTLITSENVLNGPEIEKAIKMVFEHRNTPLSLPIVLNCEELQRFWRRYLPTVDAKLPSHIAEVVDALNFWLKNNTLLQHSSMEVRKIGP